MLISAGMVDLDLLGAGERLVHLIAILVLGQTLNRINLWRLIRLKLQSAAISGPIKHTVHFILLFKAQIHKPSAFFPFLINIFQFLLLPYVLLTLILTTYPFENCHFLWSITHICLFPGPFFQLFGGLKC